MNRFIHLLFFLGLMANLSIAQTSVFEIPENASLDSIFTTIFNYYEIDEKDKKRSWKYGWLSHSKRIDADSFFQSAKQYSIDRVGKKYFYENFRVTYHSFKDDRYSNVYTIMFRFYPPGFDEEDYLKIIFKNFSFLDFKQDEFPTNLPDCRQDTTLCSFLINREKLEEIVKKELIKDEDVNFRVLELNDDYQWYCRLFIKRWPKNFFYVDARTGEITGLNGE